MSFLFGGGRQVRDAEMADAARRQRVAFYRDIGDEKSLARVDEPRYRRPKLWLVALVAIVALLAGLHAVRHPGGAPSIARSCTTPSFVLRTYTVGGSGRIDWSATGPLGVRYVLTDGPAPTNVSSAGVRVPGGKALTPLFGLPDCLAHSTLTAPAGGGSYTVRMFRQDPGGFTQVYAKALAVSG